MTRQRLFQSVWAVGLALGISVGSLGCMVTGFDLMTGGAFFRVVLWCLGFSLAGASVLHFRFAPLALIPVAAILAGTWFHGDLEASVQRLVFEISQIYNSGYGWTVLSWLDNPASGNLLPAMRVLGLALTLCVCLVLTRRVTVWLAVLPSALPLVSTLLLTDTVPSGWYLGLYLFSLVMLMLVQGVRRRDARQGNALCTIAALPVAATLALVFLLNPQSSYDKQPLADKLEKTVMDLVQHFRVPEELPPEPTAGNIRLPVTGDTNDLVNLENVGPKSRQTQWVMSVEGSRSGVVYLRGASFATYTGQTWRIGAQEDDRRYFPSFQGEPETMTISTRNSHSVYYLPYYCTDLEKVQDGRLENKEAEKEYTLSYYVPSLDNVALTAPDTAEGGYVQLPEETRRWAEGVVRGIVTEVGADPVAVYEAAEKIGAYVRSSATYSLQTQRMPENGADFARWFLEESETGYCIHFASTAAVLLRAAGIQARYVTGYVAQVRAGESTRVLLANAHAWVEYYLPGAGWMILEATPASGEAPEIPPPVTTPAPPTRPQSTDPNHTISATQPGTTQPGEETRPVTKPQEPEDEPQSPDAPKADLSWLRWLILPLGLIALVVGQWQLRLQLRYRWLRTGRGNRRALIYWREAEHVARILGESPPKELLRLAQKAKFSQHKLTREELIQLRNYLRQSEVRLREHPWYKQLLYRLVYALY